MLDVLPAVVLRPGHGFDSYEDRGDGIVLRFEDGIEEVAEILIGADGIRCRPMRPMAWAGRSKMAVFSRAGWAAGHWMIWAGSAVQFTGTKTSGWPIAITTWNSRKPGNPFHHAPAPVAWLRAMVFDHTVALGSLIRKDLLKDAEVMSLNLKELNVA